MSNASYQAECFAECHTKAEIQAEIERINKPHDYKWNEVGSRHWDYIREQVLIEALNRK